MPGLTPPRSAPPGRGRSSPGSGLGSCGRRCAGPVPLPTVCSGRDPAAFVGRGSLELLRDLVLGRYAVVPGGIADHDLFLHVVLVAGFAFARVLTRRGGIRVWVGMQEVRSGVTRPIRLVASLVSGSRCRG